MKIPKLADKRLMMMSIKTVFRKPRLTRPRLYNIDMFMLADVIDIRKYPIINEYVPRYFGKKKMLSIKSAEDMI